MNEVTMTQVKGHLLVKDDLNNVLVDKANAIHPQNMSRIFARALSHESNSWVNRVAFGNGGTVVDTAYKITYKTPNDGFGDPITGWKTRLYNETYSEFVDETNSNIGMGPGSAPAFDPAHTATAGPGVRSQEMGVSSQVIIEITLNPQEPLGQYRTDIVGNPATNTQEDTESDFMFDEIGLFSSGAPIYSTSGYQDVDVGEKIITDDTGLTVNTSYMFEITVNGGLEQTISITTPVAGSGVNGEILFGDIIPLINNQIQDATLDMTDRDPSTPSLPYGFMKFSVDNVAGTTSNGQIAPSAPSTVSIKIPPVIPPEWLFSNIVGFNGVLSPVAGIEAGDQNNALDSTREAERMLTHVIFSPVLKSANRSISIIYTLTISVARSIQ